MITVPLSIDDIQLAYDAVDNTPELELTKHTILTKLDVETFQDIYDIEFNNAEFEQTRIAIRERITSELKIDTKLELEVLHSKFLEIRGTL